MEILLKEIVAVNVGKYRKLLFLFNRNMYYCGYHRSQGAKFSNLEVFCGQSHFCLFVNYQNVRGATV